MSCRFCGKRTSFVKKYELREGWCGRTAKLIAGLALWDLCFIVLNLQIIQVGFMEEAKSMVFFTYLNSCIGSLIYEQLREKPAVALVFEEGALASQT